MRDELQNITLEEIEKQSEKARVIDSEEFTRFILERMSRPHFYEVIDSYSYHNKLKAMRAEIYEEFMTIDGGVHDESAIKCMQIIGKYMAESEDKG